MINEFASTNIFSGIGKLFEMVAGGNAPLSGLVKGGNAPSSASSNMANVTNHYMINTRAAAQDVAGEIVDMQIRQFNNTFDELNAGTL